MTVAAVVPLSTSVPFCVVDITPDARAAAARALRTGWITTGPEVAAFEDEFAAHGRRPSCGRGVVVHRGAAAGPASTRTPSWLARAHALDDLRGGGARDSQAGFQPVLVDIDPETLMPAPEHVAAAAARGPRPTRWWCCTTAERRRTSSLWRTRRVCPWRAWSRTPRTRSGRDSGGARRRHAVGGNLFQLLRDQESAAR